MRNEVVFDPYIGAVKKKCYFTHSAPGYKFFVLKVQMKAQRN